MGLKKKILLILLVQTFTLNTLMGEVKNGYESEVKGMRESLKRLSELLQATGTTLSVFQKAVMKTNIHKLEDYIAYFELTEKLIQQFRIISPNLYQEINSLTDPTGEQVTVYVKFIPEKEMQRGAAGTTNLDQSQHDKNVYQSEFGLRTISVKIASVTRSLLLLAHEFGHIKYQVANLGEYFEYYNRHYSDGTFKSSYIGHLSNDRSGHKAIEFENLFREQYSDFIRASEKKIGSPIALLHVIRKNLFHN